MLILRLFLVHLVFLSSSWVQVDTRHITGADIAAWPYSVGILVRFISFLHTLHWPSGSDDLGHFGVSFLELLILFSNGFVTDCSAKRFLGLMLELFVPF